MSKTALKKELAGFSADQLRDIILACYDSSPQAKDYLEFFLNPDVNTLMQKRIEEIDKELHRTKWSYCKARVSVINAAIKSFAAYGVPKKELATFLINVLVCILRVEFISYLSDSHYRAFARYLMQYLELMNSMEAMSVALKNLDTLKSKASDRLINIIDHVSEEFAQKQGLS